MIANSVEAARPTGSMGMFPTCRSARPTRPSSFTRTYRLLGSLRYGLGARGAEKVPPLIVGYPIYDDHGNMIATLGKNGVLADQRSYDAWGVIRTGNTTGEPHGQYCANLGHLADDESGLIYMRARYYEPGSGRFVSQDPAHQGTNWFLYASNNPACKSDASGCFAWLVIAALSGFIFGALGASASGQSWIIGGLVGMTSGLAGAAFANPAVGGAVGGFVDSILNDFATGGPGNINIGKALATAGLGGVLASAAKAVMALMGSQARLAAYFADSDLAGSLDKDLMNAEAALGGSMGAAGGSALQIFF